ncbi:DegV family protein [Priestia filamentosa]|uniref:DegV family protein n=1 Tax=Priestia filamentosa TaxID=1402861 RepID=UPI002E220CFA|nr:DegV family protein [Priestia filamentosa]
MAIQLITDSGADLSQQTLSQYNITSIPLRVHINGVDYEDSQSLYPEELYEHIRLGDEAKTSQPSPTRLYEILEPLAKKGDPMLYIAFSSALSGTYQTALSVREELLTTYPNVEFEIIDSKCASLGQGLAVYYTAQQILQSKSFEEVIEQAKFYCKNIEHIFTVDDLSLLAKGGRVSKTAAFVGGLLNIKPLLHVEDGKLIPLEKIRGRKKVFRRMVEHMKHRAPTLSNQIIAISHGDDEHAAIELKEMIVQEFGPQSFMIEIIGAVIGSHAGPGALALFFVNEAKATDKRKHPELS